jgi:cell division protein FtsI (penicillin-binding protein 3)
VIKPSTAKQVREMLESVVSKRGTAPDAAVAGYRVAGKTGTVRKASNGGYSNRYIGLFVGMAPLTHPRLVLAVMLDEPAGQYYGGVIAAPVFSEVMSGALRLLDIPPDASP